MIYEFCEKLLLIFLLPQVATEMIICQLLAMNSLIFFLPNFYFFTVTGHEFKNLCLFFCDIGSEWGCCSTCHSNH